VFGSAGIRGLELLNLALAHAHAHLLAVEFGVSYFFG